MDKTNSDFISALHLFVTLLMFSCGGGGDKQAVQEMELQAMDTVSHRRDASLMFTYWVGLGKKDSVFLKLGQNSIDISSRKIRRVHSQFRRQADVLYLQATGDTCRVMESSGALVVKTSGRGKLFEFTDGIIFTKIEDLVPFMMQFSTDKEFQLQRIRFPLRTFNDTSNVVQYMNQNDWTSNNGFVGAHPGDFDCIINNGCCDFGPELREFMWQDCDTDYLSRYKFTRLGIKWYMTEVYIVPFREVP